MKAMILAAGRGERMRPLTESTPKPLLNVGGKPLLVHQLNNLALAGFQDVVINIAYLGEQIRDYIGNIFSANTGQHLSIQYSEEPEPLETAGAIAHALPLLGDQPFLLINGDIWTDYPFQSLKQHTLSNRCLGHLVLVPNPAHHPEGDFAIESGYLTEKKLSEKNTKAMTFSGISVLSPKLISDYPECRRVFPLGEVFRHALKTKKLSAESYQGQWWDIGTVERLNDLDLRLRG